MSIISESSDSEMKEIFWGKFNMKEEAVGFIETRNWSALMAASDAMNKAAEVESLGEVKTGGGYVTTMVSGDVGAVRAAVEAGTHVAKSLGEFVSDSVIPRLHPEVRIRLIGGGKFKGDIQDYLALGLVETIGFAAMVMAGDAGYKAADVNVIGYFIPGGGHHTVVFRGETAAVEAAVQTGATEASKINKVMGQHVIPKPHPGVQKCFPLGAENIEIPSLPDGIALGFIETKGFIPIVEATDVALKTAAVEILGSQQVGSGFMSVIMRGEVGAVKRAVEEGVAAARNAGELKSTLILTGPHQAVQIIIPQPKKKS